jgi:uncharacterized protein (TIGR00730 family)
VSDSSIVCDNAQTTEVIEQALGNLWAVANSLSRIKPADSEAYRVSVFGSARISAGQTLYEEVKRLTKKLAENGCDIVTGGGPGLMQAANEGAQLGDPEDKVRSIGIRIELPFEQGANPFVEQLYSHQTFYTRLHQFVRLSHAFVVVGGGIGTTLETLLVWQLLQVRHIDLPFILVGSMWRELVEWGQRHMLSHDPPLANADDFEVPLCVDTVDEAIELLEPHIQRFKAERS